MKLSTVVALCFLLSLLIGTCRTDAQVGEETAILKGRVTDLNGNPVPNATVVVIDWYFQRAFQPLKTDSTGHYEAEVRGGHPHSYRIYAYLANGSRVLAPSTFEKEFLPLIGEVTSIPDLRLVPGAMLNLTGESWNVFSGRYALSLKAQVLDPASGEILTSAVDPRVGDYTPFYGDNITSIFVNSRWMSRFLFSRPWIVVIIPANKPVEIGLIASQPGAADQVYVVQNGSESFNLPEGSLFSVDITPFAYRWSLSAIQKASEFMWANMREAERLGFFLAALKETALNEVDAQIEFASSSIERGDFSDEGVQMPLRRAYIFATGFIINELKEMRNTAAEGAQMLPFFLAIFSIVLAFFFFEKEQFRFRFLSFMVIFVIVIVSFYFLYPGVALILSLYSDLFFAAILGSVIVSLLVIFVLPRIVFEAGNPVEIGFRSVLAVTFMLGKRYVKLRRLRSSLVIISLCTLISAVTTLTSVTSIFGLESEVVGPSAGEWVLMKNPGEKTNTFIPIDPVTLFSIQQEPDIQLVTPKAETLPSSLPGQYSIELKKDGRTVVMLGIIGVLPDLERKYVNVNVAQGSYIQDDKSLMVSLNAAQKLGLPVGSNISLSISSGGLSFELPMRVAGFFDDGEFDTKSDLNGDFYAPTTLIGEDIVPCNASQVILMSFDKALKLASKPYNMPISISRMIVEFKDPSDTDGITKFVQIQAWARGFDVWVSSAGQMLRYFLGTRIEIRYYDILLPLAIVMMSITAVMYGAVERRRREIFVYTTVGFNPLHIALVFVAESATMGLMGGGLGYLTGLTVFRLMKIISEFISVGVRENLQWWMSIVGVLVGMLITTISAIPPALKAARLAAPSVLRRIRRSPEEERLRYEEIYKGFGERRVSMPIRVQTNEALILSSFLYDQIKELAGGFTERVEDVKKPEEMQMPDGSNIISIQFRYIFHHRQQWFSTSNTLIIEQKPKDDFYRVYISSTVEQEGMPELIRERVMKIIYNKSLDWVKRREKILQSFRRGAL